MTRIMPVRATGRTMQVGNRPVIRMSVLPGTAAVAASAASAEQSVLEAEAAAAAAAQSAIDAAEAAASGGIVSIVPGANIAVDNTDPANPVVSATAEAGAPLVYLVTGQSGAGQTPSYSWTPDPKAFLWPWNGSTPSAFVDMPTDVINWSRRKASEIAKATGRTVYLIQLGVADQAIAQWKVGASPPDMYALCKTQVEAALTALGRTTIDLFDWHQGESDAASQTTYLADFETVIARFRAETWFPITTPITVMGITPASIGGSAIYGTMNLTLQRAAGVDPDHRMFVSTGSIVPADQWADTVHLDGDGNDTLGFTAARAFLNGQRRAMVQGYTYDEELDRHAFGAPGAAYFVILKDQSADTGLLIKNGTSNASATASTTITGNAGSRVSTTFGAGAFNTAFQEYWSGSGTWYFQHLGSGAFAWTVSVTEKMSLTATLLKVSADIETTGAIQLGHASDTTIARSSAGVVTIEGNVIYRAGGTDVPIADGGTGSSTASGARDNLGLGTGDGPQFAAIQLGNASDTTLARASAGNLSVEGNLVYRAGGTDVPLTDGGTGASDASGARTNLGLVIGTNVQAWDADLDAIVAGTPTPLSAAPIWRVLRHDAAGWTLTGTTTETALRNVLIPGGSVGANGMVRVTTLWSHTNSANNKTFRVRANATSGTSGSQYTGTSATTTDSSKFMTEVHNRNSASSQVGGISAGTGGWGATSNAIVTSTIDTSADWYLNITIGLANAADTAKLEAYTVEVLYQA